MEKCSSRNLLIKRNVPLAPLSTFGIGGCAKLFTEVKTPEELKKVILWATKEKKPYTLFAGGSNVVFPDENIDSLVIQVKGGTWKHMENRLLVDSGTPLASIVDYSIQNNLEGLEYLSGIPGTVGGAVVGNAGAYGRSISDVVECIDVFDGVRKNKLTKEECAFGYRDSIFKKKNLVLISICLRLSYGNGDTLRRLSSEIIKQREAKYHPGIKCPGSFFKNVLEIDVGSKSLALIDQDVIIGGKIPAGYLLGEVDAKGMSIGGIEVARYHGNLFINTGKGKAKDVKKLAGILKEKVWKRFHIHLEEEIRYL